MSEKNKKKYVRFSEIVKHFIDQNSSSESANDVWLDIVGEKLASRCALVDIKNTCLIIEVEHPAVAQDLMFDKNNIIKKVNKKYPSLNVNKIRTTVKKQYVYKKAELARAVKPKKDDKVQVELNPHLPDTIKAIFERIKSHSEKQE